MLNGLASVNIELTSRCNKVCAMCGRRKIERDYPELAKWGDMDYELLKSIAGQLPEGIVCQFHDNGEPLLYPRLGEALALFKNQVRCLDTNGKLLMEKADEIIGNLDTITVSIIERDTESREQIDVLTEFRRYRNKRSPVIIGRFLGQVDTEPYKGLVDLVVKRQLHHPMGSFQYQHEPTIPEIGICQDFLHHLAIKRDGSVSHCVRFDPLRKGVLGNLNETTLDAIWNGRIRALYKGYHLSGQRKRVPLCETCAYWGVPSA